MIQYLSSSQNPLIKHLVKLRKEKDYRYQKQSVIVDGVKAVTEISRFYSPKLVVVTSESFLTNEMMKGKLFVSTDDIMKKISGLDNPEGIIAEFPMPKMVLSQKIHYLIALDGVNDPGNLGTLLRTALALGWEAAYLLPNSCDPFNEKAIRAAKGATFRLPLAMGTWENLKEIVQINHLEPIVADIKGENPLNFVKSDKKLLVLGNEAHGASIEAMNFCKKCTIPMPGNMESLNVSVAGGILMYLLRMS